MIPKFRVWDVSRSEMLSQDMLEHWKFTDDSWKVSRRDDRRILGQYDIRGQRYNFGELMLYSNRHTDEGTQICEDDIVLVDNLGEVAEAVVKYDDDGHYIWLDGSGEEWSALCNEKVLKVIGNKHQNPEKYKQIMGD